MQNFIDGILNFISVPIHKEGHKFLLIFALATLILWLLSDTLGLIGLVLTIWCAFFFRDPHRVTPINPAAIISPADGLITKVEYGVNVPSVLAANPSEKWNKISIFLNVFDVHVNRSPAKGKILDIEYQPGKFLNANDDASSQENEKNIVVLQTDTGFKIAFVQVAGLIARRIVCNVTVGQQVEAGQRYGIIRFGSRVDIYLPDEIAISVLKGQRAIGGETILATSTH